MRLSARADYAVRAVVEIAARDEDVTSAHLVAEAQQIPERYLTGILVELRRSGIVASQRGMAGGYRLGRPAADITIADVIRAVEGPLAGIRGMRPEHVEHHGSAVALPELWVALRASIRSVLEQVSVADVASGRLPAAVKRLAREPGAWERR